MKLDGRFTPVRDNQPDSLGPEPEWDPNNGSDGSRRVSLKEYREAWAKVDKTYEMYPCLKEKINDSQRTR